jgi:tryptophan synthase alpha chain
MKKQLSIYLSMGYPKLDTALHLVPKLEKEGVDFLELGLPFSDPLADGETIQNTSSIALKNGMNIDLYFEQVKELRKSVKMPFIFMGYYNSVLSYGVERFLDKCRESGINGLIIPDLPIEEFNTTIEPNLNGLKFHFLITPKTEIDRIRYYDKLSNGFIYAISSNATTGESSAIDEGKKAYFQDLQKLNLVNDVCVGFGISSKQDVDDVYQHGFGAIIGSKFLKCLAIGEDEAINFIKEIRA